MDSIKNKKDKIVELIKSNNLNEIKKYVEDPKFKFYNLNSKHKYEILIYSIKNKASFGIIRYFIKQWNKEINHYSYLKKCYVDSKANNENIKNDIELPLSVAIANNNFKVADCLLEHDAILNDIPEDTLLNIVNKKNSKYLLNKNIAISKEFLLELIKSIKIYFIKDIFSYYAFNNTIIINLLLMYKKKIKSSNSDLKNLIREENNKIIINEEMYKEAFNIYFSYDDYLKNNKYDKDYELVFILYNNDRREKQEKLFDIYKVLRNFYDYQKIELIEKIKNKDLKFSVDSCFLSILEKSVSNQEKEDIMIDFVQNNNMEELQNYMKKNNIKLTDLKGEYNNMGICYYELLNRALWNENENIIKYLIDCGSDINMPGVKDKSPLHLQLYISQILKDGKDVELVKKLIKWGADINKVVDGETPLIKAVKMNHLELVQFMVENGADINKKILNNDGDTALGAAIYSKNLEIVKYLVEHGADVNNATFRSEIPLNIAINQENKEMIKYLIECGIDVNSNKNSNKYWESGALGNAASKNDMEMVKYLISCGAKVDTKALIGAIEGNNMKMVQYLIDAGADINQEVQYYGNKSVTPLHVAIQDDNQNMIEYLINHGAKVCMDDTNENSHLNTAIIVGNIDIIKYLMDWSLNPEKNSDYQKIEFKDSYMEHFK